MPEPFRHHLDVLRDPLASFEDRHAAFEELLGCRGPWRREVHFLVFAYAVAAAICRRWRVPSQWADAEDVCHESLLRLFVTVSKLEQPDLFVHFYCGIVRNICREMLKARGPASECLSETEAAPDAETLNERERAYLAGNEAFEKMISILTPKLQCVVRLRLSNEMDYAGIADTLGIKEDTARQRYRRGRDILAGRGVKSLPTA